MIIVMIAFSFINLILFAKYKPVYAVTLGESTIGYVANKDEFEKEIQNKIINYNQKNVDKVEIKEEPTYELKFIDKEEKTDEQEIIISMQKSADITYKFYEISLNDSVIVCVDNNEEAQKMVDELKNDNENIDLKITEKITTNAEEVKTNTIEVAKENILNKINEQKANENVLGVVEGIKLAAKPVEGVISSRYGVSSRIRVSTHTGLDIAASTGTQIKVVSDGTVISAAYTGAYGNLVKVSHGNGVETWYAHTSKMLVKPGQEVKAGDIIAEVGSTGNSTGPHLHFEIRINGNHVNPQNYIYNK